MFFQEFISVRQQHQVNISEHFLSLHSIRTLAFHVVCIGVPFYVMQAVRLAAVLGFIATKQGLYWLLTVLEAFQDLVLKTIFEA